MTLARTERAALADLLAEQGPDQPTLCAGWNTADLLAHLLVRERRLDAAPGILLPQLAGWMERVSAGYRRRPWAEQVALFRAGPPAYSPLRWADTKANGMEMFIHHEDVRRGQPDWQPRTLTESARAEIIPMLTAGLVAGALRKKGVPVTASLTDEPGGHERAIVLVPSTEPDSTIQPTGVVVRAAAGDVLLWLSGRSEVRIEFAGAPAAVAAVRARVQAT